MLKLFELPLLSGFIKAFGSLINFEPLLFWHEINKVSQN